MLKGVFLQGKPQHDHAPDAVDISVRKELNWLKDEAKIAEDDRKTWHIVSNVVGTI